MLSSLLCLWQSILLVSASTSAQKYSENLFIKDLPDGKIMATFDFVTAWNVNPVTFVGHSRGMWNTFNVWFIHSTSIVSTIIDMQTKLRWNSWWMILLTSLCVSRDI